LGRRHVATQLAYVHPDAGDDEILEDIFKAADMALCKRVSEVLMRHYFHPDWYVEASHAIGMVYICIPTLMGMSNGIRIGIQDLEADETHMRIVYRMAGELLERYNIPRTLEFSEADYYAALARNPLGYLGGGSRLVIPR
jgi:hypothetical protein